MRKQPYKKAKILWLLLAAFLLIAPSCVFADIFNVSYSLTEGGMSLQLSPANPHRGVNITTTSDIATRYEVIQDMNIPLSNRNDPGVVLRNNFVVRGLRGTNRFGTFHILTTDTPVRSNEVLYTSDTSGNADTFTLVYGLINVDDIPAGDYYGKISYTLRPISSNRNQVVRYLDVFVSISQRPDVQPKIEILSSRGTKTVTLSSKEDSAPAADVSVRINGAFRKMFSITQYLSRPIESNEGNRLDYGLITAETHDVSKGAGLGGKIPLSSRPLIVYTSTPSGEADDSFVITYNAPDLSAQKAGRYRTSMQFFQDESGVQKIIDTLELEVEVERLFDIVITPQDQRPLIEFRDLKPKAGAKKSEVDIEIKSNIGKRYQLSQNVYSELTNREGKTIPSKYFTLRTEKIDSKGNVKFPASQEIKKGDAVLFVSDEQGSPAKIKLIYELSIPDNVVAGDYSTRITYSLVEI